MAHDSGMTSGRGTRTAQRRSTVLLAALGLITVTAAVLQTGVVPILGAIASTLQSPAVDVSWVLTANLLAAAASTPLIGRLADVYPKKTVLLVVLAIVLAGSLLAAMTTSLPLLVVARVLQAGSFALFPVCVSTLRDEIAPQRLVRAMAVLSATLGLGGGLGLVLTGLLSTRGAGYHVVFWLHSAMSVAVLIAAALAVPRRPGQGRARIDWLGAVGLAVGLSALLLALTQGRGWGWGSPKTVATAVGGVVVLAVWWWWSRRITAPLVSTAMLSRRPLLLTNAATVLVGMGLYIAFLGVTDFVEAPAGRGYGFGATVLEASLAFLLPGAIAAALTALVGGYYVDRFGARAVGMVGAAAGLAGFVLLAVLHNTGWEIVAGYVLANAYISLAYGALPVLVVDEVEPTETAVATGINAIARTVGSAIGAAVVAVLVIPSDAGQVPEGDFVAVFTVGGLTALVAMVLLSRVKSVVPQRLSGQPT